MAKKLIIIIGLSLSLSLASCGNNFENIEQTCSADGCSETDINKQIDEPFQDEPGFATPEEEMPDRDLTKTPEQGNPEQGNPEQGNPTAPPAEDIVYDPNREIPSEALQQALDFYRVNSAMIANKNYITIIDYSQHSSEKRFFLLDMKTGLVKKYNVAHGQGSDKNNDGYAEQFSNVPESKQTSLGFFLTAETYNGENGYSMRMDGLEDSNNLARKRYIVVHGADYVKEKKSYAGRSWGCPALDRAVNSTIINKIKNGSLLYAYMDLRKLPR